jgi:hypothetical protein
MLVLSKKQTGSMCAGSLIATGLASLTLICIILLVLGLCYAIGWKLGAIEGISITVLVGLSVDFCIHFSEAFVQSPLQQRKDRAQCAPSLCIHDDMHSISHRHMTERKA